MMRNAEVIVFEDKPEEMDKIRMAFDHFNDNGHSIEAHADSPSAAESVMYALRNGAMTPDAIILDGNLSPNDTSGNDAAKIMHQIRSANLGIFVIGNSAEPMSNYGIVVDDDAQKNVFRIIKILDELPERS